MCKAFNDLIKEERREERIRIIQKMMAEGVDETFIRKVTECTKKEYLTAAR